MRTIIARRALGCREEALQRPIIAFGYAKTLALLDQSRDGDTGTVILKRSGPGNRHHEYGDGGERRPRPFRGKARFKIAFRGRNENTEHHAARQTTQMGPVIDPSMERKSQP